MSRGTRPDIAFAVAKLARHVAKWSVDHDAALERVYGYLKRTAGLGLFYKYRTHNYQSLTCPKVIVYTDSDHAGEVTTRRSTSGWVTLIADGGTQGLIVDWGSKRQGCTALSTGEAEVVALVDGVKRSGIPIWATSECTFGQKLKMTLRVDATACEGAARKGRSPAMRYIDKTQGIRLGWLADLLNDAEGTNLEKWPTSMNQADLLTKPLSVEVTELHIKQLGMRNNGVTVPGVGRSA